MANMYSVMSKSYGLAGLRVGWIATQDVTVLQQMATLKDFTTICGRYLFLRFF